MRPQRRRLPRHWVGLLTGLAVVVVAAGVLKARWATWPVGDGQRQRQRRQLGLAAELQLQRLEVPGGVGVVVADASVKRRQPAIEKQKKRKFH